MNESEILIEIFSLLIICSNIIIKIIMLCCRMNAESLMLSMLRANKAKIFLCPSSNECLGC